MKMKNIKPNIRRAIIAIAGAVVLFSAIVAPLAEVSFFTVLWGTSCFVGCCGLLAYAIVEIFDGIEIEK